MTIVATNLSKVYKQGNSKIEAVSNVNLTILDGEFVVLLGPSGGGKSTLLNLLGGIDRPTTGSIVCNGFTLDKSSEEQLTKYRREKIGFVFQFYNLLSSLTALENVILPLLAKGQNPELAKVKAAGILSEMGLAARLKHKPAELSGGEQQRVAIARAIIGEPALLIADEPTGDLDSSSAEEIINLMHDLNDRHGITFLVATHNLTLCDRADRVIEIKDGKIHE
jgi:putative ABC transport system ATP-binding protein